MSNRSIAQFICASYPNPVSARCPPLALFRSFRADRAYYEECVPGRVQQVADWLDRREPGQALDDVRNFARRHPGAFLTGAAIAGVVVGRLTRNLAGGGRPDGGTAGQPDGPTAEKQAGQPVVGMHSTENPWREEAWQ